MAVLQPSGTLSLKDILRIKDESKIKNTCLPVTKGIRNTKGASLFIDFFFEGHFDSTDACRYHLQVNDPDRIHGTSNEDYEPFHNWLTEIK